MQKNKTKLKSAKNKQEQLNTASDNDFNKNYNISYYEGNLPEPTKKLIFKHYICSLLVYGIALSVICLNKWYDSLLTSTLFGISTKGFFCIFYALYAFIAPVIYFSFRPKSLWNSNNIIICNYLHRIIANFRKPSSFPPEKGYKPAYREQQAILLLMVKLFFGPQMIQYATNNIVALMEKTGPVFDKLTTLIVNNSELSFWAYKKIEFAYFNDVYFYLITVLFLIDTAFFAVGYLTESSIFNNKVRMVENSLFGIFICLICYPPFNTVTTNFLSWHQRDNAMFFGDPYNVWTWIFRWLAVIFLTVYAIASISLFTRASNLTNRGVVETWPYNRIRHPAYISKNMFWWLTTIPILFVNITPGFDWGKYILNNVWIIVSMLCWNLIYYLRAITEEKFLMKDPEYQAYAQRVKYRFIPGIW